MSADAVLDWNDIALDAVANDHSPSIVGSPEQGGPTRTSRAMAIVHAAIFDAANAINRSFTPYLLKSIAPHTASIDAAVAQAGHDTLSVLYPKQKAIFDAALVATLNGVPNGAPEQHTGSASCRPTPSRSRIPGCQLGRRYPVHSARW